MSAASRSTISGPLSVEPSSTTMNSFGGNVCARTLRIDSSTQRAPLYSGITATIDRSGVFPLDSLQSDISNPKKSNFGPQMARYLVVFKQGGSARFVACIRQHYGDFQERIGYHEQGYQSLKTAPEFVR